MVQSKDKAFAYTGFVSDERFAAADVMELVSTTWLGNLVVARSPGGIAAFFYANARRRRSYVWSSHAGVEGVFVTRGSDCIAISNRPLLSHLVGSQRDVPRFSSEWARRTLLGGATLWDDTPYQGTHQPPPRSMVVLRGDEIAFAPHPVPLQQRRFRCRDPAGIDALNEAALRAVSVLRRWPRGELGLSGGKDSRYVAALLRTAEIEIDHFTHSSDCGGERHSAEAVARALGVELRVTPGDIVTGEALQPLILANLRRSDGLLAENRQLCYRPTPHRGQPLVHGQAHHPRGGFPSLSKDRLTVTDRLIARNLGDHRLVRAELVRERRKRLRELLDDYDCEPDELGYWMYNDWRMTRWTIASYRATSRSRPVVWPMMDEGALCAISELSPVDRSSEVAFHAALRALNREVAALPLHENMWTFDQGEGGPAAFPEDYESRRHPFKNAGGRRSPDRRISTIQPLFRHAVGDLGYAEELRSLIDPEILGILSTHPDPSTVIDVPHIQLVQFMWKATAIALVMEGDWLRVGVSP